MSRAIITHLGNADPVMKQLIAAAGPYALEAREELSPFETLARAIAHQQLNGKAAQSILNRFISTCGQGVFPEPEGLLALQDVALRASGFSFSKIAALRDLAAKTLAGVVPLREALHALSDTEIIERLTSVRGIGRWTVEMLLMFQLRRPDVLPVDDFGVRHGFRLAYGFKEMPARRCWRCLASAGRPIAARPPGTCGARWSCRVRVSCRPGGKAEAAASAAQAPQGRRQTQARRSFCSSASTIGCTNSCTSPPSTAISRTKEEEMNVNCSCGVRNTDSISRHRWRFMFASWNSNSKSDTARSPRMITDNWCRARELHGEFRVAHHFHVGHVHQHLARQVHALLLAEQRRLAGVRGDGHHHPIEQPARPPHQVDVAVGNRIKGPGVQRVSIHRQGVLLSR